MKHPIAVSFEFFPPKTAAMEAGLWSAIRKLEPLAPEFVSVTYGAGGSTRERTHSTVARIISETALKPAAHLTCVPRRGKKLTPLFAIIGTPEFARSLRFGAILPLALARPMSRIRAVIKVRLT